MEKIKLASLVMNDWFKFEDLKYTIKNNDYEIGEEIVIKICKGLIYKENSYIVDEVLEILNTNGYDYSEQAECYMQSVPKSEKQILNNKLLEVIRQFQQEFQYKPYFYGELENIETLVIKVIDLEGNYEIIG